MYDVPEKIVFCKLSDIPRHIKDYKNVIVVGNHISPISGVKTISIPDGEEAKTLEVVKILWDMFERYEVDHSSLIISMGGGSASDAVGFAAATYMRGVHFASIPTTLLAMVDASIGSKRALNTQSAKNLLGCFYPAETLFIDPNFLDTLSEEQIKSGLCEAIKLSFISGFDLDKDINKLIEKCIKAKQQIVARDVFDKLGLRQTLNYGHTLGHAIEAHSKFSIPHGLAVGLGMDFAASSCGNLEVQKAQNRAFEKFGVLNDLKDLKKSISKDDVEAIVQFMKFDKKKHEDTISLVELKKIGEPRIKEIMIEDIKSNLLEYLS